MFTLRSQRLRRRLSAPTSGSLRRRARERKKAEQTRIEGEQLARERREQRTREKLKSQLKAQAELASYAPWGKAGGGAPNPRGVRFSNLRAKGIFPEDELRGVSLQEACHRWTTSQQRSRRQTPIRLREDPQILYAENLRKSVDNDIRYKQAPAQQMVYKKILDDMVDKRKKAEKAENKRELEYEKRLLAMDGPWGKPGPGGTIWRNPRNIGLNFSKSMGWTNNEIFTKLKGDHRQLKRSSLTLPTVKRDDDYYKDEGDTEAAKGDVTKLPNIGDSPKSGRHQLKFLNENIKNSNDTITRSKRSSKKLKFIKRLSNGERLKRIFPGDDDSHNESHDGEISNDKKLTPEGAILRLTGGVELVPLLARRRRVGARTLPSSDVTRPPEQPCQWRELLNVDYLRELKHQMRVKCEKKEEIRRNSAESVKQHHVTWASLWGRPGHGAPQQRGRYARSNLAQILYVAPLAQS
ncbi:uncharacterized protein LOC101745757 [Bombyx mori]